jgi:TatD DNase family protein
VRQDGSVPVCLILVRKSWYVKITFMLEKKISYFDTHSHIHSDFFNQKQSGQEVVDKMAEENIFSVVIGVDLGDSKQALEMASKNENIFCSIGQHPVDNETEFFDEEKYQNILDKDREDSGQKKVVCVGECGLDYFWLNKDLGGEKISKEVFSQKKIRQKNLFEIQIDFAVKNNLPLMLHIRSFKNSDAHWDCFDILDKKQKEHEGRVRANFHFFTEGVEIVQEVIKRNFFISLPGVITFANLDDSIKKIPIENLMSETDSPYAAPKPHRGKTNTPLYIQEVVKKIAEVKNISQKECNDQLIKNAINFFNLV